jgi:malonate transporter
MADIVSTMRIFVRVVETGSFTAVAKENNATAAQVSRAVTALEPFKLDAQTGFGIVLSNVVQPLIALALVSLLGVPKAIPGQAILLAAIPCGSFGILFGLPYGISDASAGTTHVASSLLSAVTLSGTIVLLGYL